MTLEKEEASQKDIKKQAKKQTKKKLTLVLSLVLLFLILLLLIQANIINNPFLQINKKVQKLEVTDLCSVIGGKLINTIPDEDLCINRCVAECYALDGKLKGSEFFIGQETCNKCFCYCKH